MKINEIGEKLFLQSILVDLKKNPAFINGFGNDASVLDIGINEIAIAMKIDRAGKPIAAQNKWCDYKLWGRLAVTANCSDILAIGAIPTGFMLSVMVPGSFEAETLKEIILGAEEECARNNIAFLGGDTKESIEAQVVGSAIGVANKRHILSRSGAKPGDVLVLAGTLGGFVGGYNLIVDGASSPDDTNQIINYMSHPKARWMEAALINKLQLGVAATDLSDGLLDGINSIANDKHGICLYLDRIPYHNFSKMASEIMGIELFNLGMGVGDWGILYAMPSAHVATLASHDAFQAYQFSIIGHITESKGVFGIGSSDGDLYKIHGIINENFRQRMEDQGDYFHQIKINKFLFPTQNKEFFDINLDIKSQIIEGLE